MIGQKSKIKLIPVLDNYIGWTLRTLALTILALNVAQQAYAISAPVSSSGPLAVSIDISSTGNTLEQPGEELQLTVTANMSDGTTENITNSVTGIEYESTDASVVTVGLDGLVTAAGVGTAKIIANIGLVIGEIEIQVLNPLNENCIAGALNRQVPVNSDGTFALGNLPLADGFFRVRVFCEKETEIIFAHSEFLTSVPNGSLDIGSLTFGTENPSPLSLQISSPNNLLTAINPEVQLTVLGTFPGNFTTNLTGSSSGTFYTSSNPGIASVNAEGLVTAASSGTVLITARNEGAVATAPITVQFTDDTDDDGIPDDFELVNSINPGGSNQALLPGTDVTASSFTVGSEPEKVIDGRLDTSWFTQTGDAANLNTTPSIEITLPGDVNVSQIRILGNRPPVSGRDFILGIVEALDANDISLFNSGLVALPAPRRDLAVALDIDGVRKVRFTSTQDESNSPGLSEVQVLSRPGGIGLDATVAADALQDFDNDSLTNLEEFILGTSIFIIDTDGDEISDSNESTIGSNPLLADSDFDGLLDSEEVQPDADTDGDGLINVLDPDSDDDGLPDGVEIALNLDPLKTISKFGSQTPDGLLDSDGDGVINIVEIGDFTDPGNRDTDGDGLEDGEEINTDPLRFDTDGDGMSDGFEVNFGLDPNDPNDGSDDEDGDGLTNLEEFQLGTSPIDPDVTAPAVAQVDPADGEVTLTNRIVVRFNEPMMDEGGTLLNTGFALFEVIQGGDDIPVSGTAQLSDDGLSITYSPSNLAPDSQFAFSISGLRDEAGNLMSEDFQSSFSTDDQSTIIPGPILLGVNILDGQTNVPVNEPFVVEFNTPVDPTTVTPFTFSLVKNPGQNEISVPGTVQVDPGNKRASFVPDENLEVNAVEYRAKLTRFITNQSGENLKLDEAGSIDRTFTFTTSSNSDLIAPNLASHYPAALEMGVPTNISVILDFDEPLKADTEWKNAVKLKLGTNQIAGSYALSNSNKRITFMPENPFAPNTIYTVEIPAGLVDRVGNATVGQDSFDFTTGTVSVGDRITVSQDIPIKDAQNVAVDTDVTVGFSDEVIPFSINEGTLSIWNVPLGLNDFVPGSTQLAGDNLSATISPESQLLNASEFEVQTSTFLDRAGRSPKNYFDLRRFSTAAGADTEAPFVVLATPHNEMANLPLNPLIIAQLNEPIGGTNLDPDWMDVSIVTGEEEMESIDGTVDLNAARDQLTFVPDSPLIQDSSYYVTVKGFADAANNPVEEFMINFNTSPTAISDVTDPEMTSVTPADGAVFVLEDSNIIVQFDERINPFSINANSIKVTSSGNSIDGTYSIDPTDETKVIFNPTGFLPHSAIINIEVITSGDDIVQDLAGNSLGFALPPSSFTVIPPPF